LRDLAAPSQAAALPAIPLEDQPPAFDSLPLALPDTWPLEARLAQIEQYPREVSADIMPGAVAQALADAGARVVHIHYDGIARRVVPAAEAADELANKILKLERKLADLEPTVALSTAAIAERDRAIAAWKQAGAIAKAQHAKAVADLERKLAAETTRAYELEQRLRLAGERAQRAERKLANAAARERTVAMAVAEFGRHLQF